MENKKALFKAAGLDPFLVAALGLLKAGHETFVANAIIRAPADKIDVVKEVALVISNALQDGIDTFEAD